MSQSNGNRPFDVCLQDYTGSTDADHSDRVRFMPSPSANDIPHFLQHRRGQLIAKLRSVAESISKFADRAKASEGRIEKLLMAADIGSVQQEIEQERGRLQVWSLALEMKRAELASIAQRVAS
jgi:hypothetical protein